MFTISFKCNAARLAGTLEQLSAITGSDVTVSSDQPAEATPVHRRTGAKTPAARGTSSASNRRPSAKAKTPAGGESQVARAGHILDSIGAQEFTAKTFLSRTEKEGINKASAYAAVREAIAAGTIARIEPGLFRRTGAGMAEALGLEASNG